MISDSVKVSTFDTSTAAGGSPIVGLDPRWENELTTLTEDEAKLKRIHLRAKKCIVYVTASNEVIADGGLTRAPKPFVRVQSAATTDVLSSRLCVRKQNLVYQIITCQHG